MDFFHIKTAHFYLVKRRNINSRPSPSTVSTSLRRCNGLGVVKRISYPLKYIKGRYTNLFVKMFTRVTLSFGKCVTSEIAVKSNIGWISAFVSSLDCSKLALSLADAARRLDELKKT